MTTKSILPCREDVGDFGVLTLFARVAFGTSAQTRQIRRLGFRNAMSLALTCYQVEQVEALVHRVADPNHIAYILSNLHGTRLLDTI